MSVTELNGLYAEFERALDDRDWGTMDSVIRVLYKSGYAHNAKYLISRRAELSVNTIGQHDEDTEGKIDEMRLNDN